MPVDKLITANLSEVVSQRLLPGITLWNRLEGRPRHEQFERALRAELRDPLWLLTRQWQMGEFRGDDAASPFFAKAHVETSRFRKFRAAEGAVEEIDANRPLEPHVERLPLRFFHGAGKDEVPVALDLRIALGRYWQKLVAPLAAGAAVEFVTAYPIDAPDPADDRDALITAHPPAWASFALAGGRLMDGYKLYRRLVDDPSFSAATGIVALAGMEAAVAPVTERFVRWVKRLVYQPDGDGAWRPERFEYRFSASVPQASAEKVLVAEEYYHGHLDWHAFDFDPQQASLGTPRSEAPSVHRLTMLPTNLTFNGMPHTRWWRFEDGLTNFGAIVPNKTDLAKVMLIEFGLVYANDWLLIPFTLPAGSLAHLRGLAVTNVFGERVWVEAAGRGADDDWQRWAMFLVSTTGDNGEAADLSLVVPPIAHQVSEGRPLEEILVARDEMANMVWAIEKIVALPNGEARLGASAATETLDWYRRKAGDAAAVIAPDPVAPIRYQVMTAVPENWIPMVSNRTEGSNRETQLQRAAALRLIDGLPGDPLPVEPRTALLRQGLDRDPRAPFFLHEEEVPRSGIRVFTAFQRTRTRTGEALVWLGARKQTGRGAGSSGLAFDQILNAK